jgi:hypothetical protein
MTEYKFTIIPILSTCAFYISTQPKILSTQKTHNFSFVYNQFNRMTIFMEFVVAKATPK